jgi:hypothetical protein
MKLVAVIVVAILCTVLTDVLGIVWLAVMREHFDLTGNYWLLVAVPAVAVVVALQALVLWRIYRIRPLYHGGIFLAVYSVAEVLYLTVMQNPTADIARYLAIILVVGGIVLSLFMRFAWQPREAAPPRP